LDGRNKKFILELQKKPKLRRESGLYTIDGPKMAGEIDPFDAENIFVTKEFLSSKHFEDCAELIKSRPYTLISEAEMKQLSDTVSPQGILVVAKQKKYKGLGAFAEASLKYAADNNAKAPLFVLLETLQDPGNLGTVIRACEAAGATGIIADAETVDIYSPKVVRSTMGAILRLPYIAVQDLKKAADLLKSGELCGQSVRLYAAHLDGAKDYTAVDFTGPSAFMIGNESRGLSDELTKLADEKILIPMCGHTESLNAAVAAAVICFEASRQRRKA